ncbi:hypothetical protein VNO77_44218 [Canavalia gladiata]|uniref:Uncharacterized protein n=1 Tax=Canavalia gladiata TaxID=3824 RepID=A0AAN9PQ60_CANGL
MLQWKVQNATFFYQVSRFFRRKISPRGLVPAIEGNTKLLHTNVSFTLVLSDRIGLYSCIWDVKQNLAELYSQGQEPKVAPCIASACIPLASFCYTFKFIAEFYGKPQEAREQERCWVVNLERTVLKLQWRESYVDAAVGLLNIYFEGPVRRLDSVSAALDHAEVTLSQGEFLRIAWDHSSTSSVHAPEAIRTSLTIELGWKEPFIEIGEMLIDRMNVGQAIPKGVTSSYKAINMEPIALQPARITLGSSVGSVRVIQRGIGWGSKVRWKTLVLVTQKNTKEISGLNQKGSHIRFTLQ